MKEAVLRLWPRSQQRLTDYVKSAKSAEEREIAVLKEHPRLLLMLAAGFLFGFGFLFAIGYMIYNWLRSRRAGAS